MCRPIIQIKRAYEPPASGDGLRVLVDRVWPRGRSKDDMQLDHWMKSLAPSAELRQWFDHDPAKWATFKKRYFDELRQRKNELHALLEAAGDGPVTLVFAARDQRYNNAVALREYLRRLRR
ncbi:MAG: DUF488 family protein [Phycisphaeraceae bacterium]